MTAGQVVQTANSNMSEEDLKTDLYKPQYNISGLRRLVDHGVEEYNKTQPRIKLALYRVSGHFSTSSFGKLKKKI